MLTREADLRSCSPPAIQVVLLIPRLACLTTPYSHPRPPPSTTVDLLSNPSLAGWNPTPYYKPPPTVKPPFRSASAHLLVAARDAGLMLALTLLARPFDRLLDLGGASLWDLEGEDVPWLPAFVPYVHPLHRHVGIVGGTAIFGVSEPPPFPPRSAAPVVALD